MKTNELKQIEMDVLVKWWNTLGQISNGSIDTQIELLSQTMKCLNVYATPRQLFDLFKGGK